MSHSIHLRELEAAGLVSLVSVLPEVEYLFRHTLIQEAAYGSLLKSDRQALHKLTGLVLEDLYQDREEEIAPILAQHFHTAGDNERALKYFIQSGDKAMATYAIQEAIEHYKFALDIAKQTPASLKVLKRLFLKLGSAYELNAQYELGLENYQEMEVLATERRDDGMKLAAIVSRAKVYATPSASHNADKVQALSKQALELAEKTGDKTAQTRIHWILSLLYARTGRFLDSIMQGEKAIVLARELENRELLAYSLHDVSQSYVSTNQFKKGYEAITESQNLWRALGNLPMLVDNLSTMIAYNYFKGELDHALSNYEEALSLSEMIGNLWGQAYCRMYIGSIYYDRGHPEEAMQTMKKCIELAKEAGFIVPSLETQAELGMVYAYLGESERGLEIINAALENSGQEIGGWDAWAKSIKARVHIERCEFEEARKLMRSAEVIFQQGDPLGFARIYFLGIQCELAIAEKDYEKALELFHLFTKEEILTDVRVFKPWLDYMHGITLLRLGELEIAQDTLVTALNEAENMQMRRILWQTQSALAEVAEKLGQIDEAKRFRTKAQDIVNYIAARIGNEELRDSFLNRPDVIALWETK